MCSLCMSTSLHSWSELEWALHLHKGNRGHTLQVIVSYLVRSYLCNSRHKYNTQRIMSLSYVLGKNASNSRYLPWCLPKTVNFLAPLSNQHATTRHFTTCDATGLSQHECQYCQGEQNTWCWTFLTCPDQLSVTTVTVYHTRKHCWPWDHGKRPALTNHQGGWTADNFLDRSSWELQELFSVQDYSFSNSEQTVASLIALLSGF